MSETVSITGPIPSKYQKGEERHISRTLIKEAPYNPRVIGEGAAKRIRAMIKTMGLLGTVIWNERTGNLVSGHQRLKALDCLEGFPDKTPDYDVRVTVVDLSQREEKKANVFFNNPSAQGEWDIDKLSELVLDDDIQPSEMGFTDTDMALLFGGDERFDSLFSEPEEVTATKEQIQEVRDHRNTSTQAMEEAQGADFFFTVICQSQKAKDDLLRAIGVPVCEQFVNGSVVALKMDVKK